MKKINIIGLFVIFGAVIPSVALASFNRPLSYGSSGNDVEQLQELLISENCLSAQPTGYFGLLTLKGVECFQTKSGISATGYFGNLSIAQANSTITVPTASSTTEQVAETGTTTCPTGYTCTPTISIQLQPIPLYASSSVNQITQNKQTATSSANTNNADKGIPYQGMNGNWYYPNAYDSTGRPLEVPAPPVNVVANPTTIPYESSSTISWTSTNSTSCTLNSSPVLLATAGSESTGALTTSTTYTVTCTGNNGSNSGSVTVNVPQSSINYYAAAKDCYVGGGTLYPQFPCLNEMKYQNTFPYDPSEFGGLTPPF